MRLQPVHVRRQQLLAEALGNAVDGPGRRALLVGAEDEALALLAHVVGGVALAEHREFRQALLLALLQFGRRLGDEILVLDGDDGDVEADHGGGLARPGAGGGDDMLAGDIALVGLHQPFAVRLLLDARDLGLAVDLAAARAGSLGQGHGDVGGRHVAVIGMIERADQPLGIAERPQLLDLGRRDDLERHADGVRGAAVLVVLVHAVAVGGEAEVAGLVEADGLAGLALSSC